MIMKIEIVDAPTAINLQAKDKSSGVGYSWWVMDQYKVTVKIDGNLRTITVGCISTDLASVPKIPFAYSEFKLLNVIAPVTHDFLYVMGTVDDESKSKESRLPKKVCDLIFRELLIYKGVSKIKAYTMWAAVALFGKKYFNSHKVINYA